MKMTALERLERDCAEYNRRWEALVAGWYHRRKKWDRNGWVALSELGCSITKRLDYRIRRMPEQEREAELRRLRRLGRTVDHDSREFRNRALSAAVGMHDRLEQESDPEGYRRKMEEAARTTAAALRLAGHPRRADGSDEPASG